MKKRILMVLALIGVSLAIFTCGEGSSVAANSEHHVSRDVDLYMHPCDVSEDGRTIVIQSSGETVVCEYDEYLEDWAWIPKK